jgi:SAM-dependent MidA family methyltransferase
VDPGNPDLVEFIREKIRRDGPVSFAWFMEQALYHPQFGYYSSGRCQIGRKGDYFTNVSVGSLFGRILAAQFAEMWEILGRPGDFTIVEQGAHHGDFASDVLKAVRERDPNFFAALQYAVVEPFPVLEARQRDTLRDFQGKVTWWKSLDQLAPFCGVHFSNELLDAMPVRLVERVGENPWQERLVALSEKGFEFVTKPITDERLRERLPNLPAAGAGTHATEINLAALDWIERVSAKLRRGFVLAVDYGFPRAEFFAAERTGGTLQGYAAHQTVSSPLHEIGHADIAAHVEWTSLAGAAEQCGLAIVGFTDQHHFMTGMLSLVSPNETERRALQTLIHPEFLGTRFQYLALARDVLASGLSGFRFARDARKALGGSSAPLWIRK